MTRAQLRAAVQGRIGETPGAPAYYSAAEIHTALDEAQQILAIVSLFYERTATLTVTAGQPLIDTLAVIPDWIVALRARTASGRRIMPRSFAQLQVISPMWSTERSESPHHYVGVGANIMVISPTPTTGTTTIECRYAASPPALNTDSTSPVLPADYIPALVSYSIVRLRAKEGGSEFSKVQPEWERFQLAAAALVDECRSRQFSSGYDITVEPLQPNRNEKI